MTNEFNDELDVSDPVHPLFPTVWYPIVPLITSQGRGVAKIGRHKDAADDHVPIGTGPLAEAKLSCTALRDRRRK